MGFNSLIYYADILQFNEGPLFIRWMHMSNYNKNKRQNFMGKKIMLPAHRGFPTSDNVLQVLK